jgi:hypothetical protein
MGEWGHFLFGGWTPDAQYYAIVGAGLGLAFVIAGRMVLRAMFRWAFTRVERARTRRRNRRRPATRKPTPTRRRPSTAPRRKPSSSTSRRPAKARRG